MKRKGRTQRLRRRSPVAPPTYVIGKTGYDRARTKRALVEELQELKERFHQQKKKS